MLPVEGAPCFCHICKSVGDSQLQLFEKVFESFTGCWCSCSKTKNFFCFVFVEFPWSPFKFIIIMIIMIIIIWAVWKGQISSKSCRTDFFKERSLFVLIIPSVWFSIEGDLKMVNIFIITVENCFQMLNVETLYIAERSRQSMRPRLLGNLFLVWLIVGKVLMVANICLTFKLTHVFSQIVLAAEMKLRDHYTVFITRSIFLLWETTDCGHCYNMSERQFNIRWGVCVTLLFQHQGQCHGFISTVRLWLQREEGGGQQIILMCLTVSQISRSIH